MHDPTSPHYFLVTPTFNFMKEPNLYQTRYPLGCLTEAKLTLPTSPTESGPAMKDLHGREGSN